MAHHRPACIERAQGHTTVRTNPPSVPALDCSVDTHQLSTVSSPVQLCRGVHSRGVAMCCHNHKPSAPDHLEPRGGNRNRRRLCRTGCEITRGSGGCRLYMATLLLCPVLPNMRGRESKNSFVAGFHRCYIGVMARTRSSHNSIERDLFTISHMGLGPTDQNVIHGANLTLPCDLSIVFTVFAVTRDASQCFTVASVQIQLRINALAPDARIIAG
mmetsp:Transcript_2486/g.6912  ORF Transcript_2486/g.6912 Transcript_2486/m.6912 type:complete len:215 (-) Transcript_2486:28-672(-)